MATDHIRYDLLVQNAFREIFRKVLTDVAAKGLPGEHHFLITFRTGAPGVKMSDRLRQAHPHDMTIVLQHQFWDLLVNETGFSVGLSFKHVPEKLVVPFSAVTGFFDPSVNFGAEFTAENEDEKRAEGAPKPLAIPSPKDSAAKGRLRGSGSEPAEVGERASGIAPDALPKPAARDENDRPKDGVAKEDEPAPPEGPKVVSIDAFRKKH